MQKHEHLLFMVSTCNDLHIAEPHEILIAPWPDNNDKVQYYQSYDPITKQIMSITLWPPHKTNNNDPLQWTSVLGAMHAIWSINMF